MNIVEAESLVREAIARHLGVAVDHVRGGHSFARDLQMHPLDIVLVVLDLEEREQIELPLDLLDTLTTVGELAWLLQLGAASRSEPLTRRASGF
jgi:acyl carrier protein